MPKPIPSRTSLDLFPPVKGHHIEQAFAAENRFVRDAAGLVLPNAWLLAELSLLAYADPDVIRAELKNVALSLVGAPINGRSTQGFVAQGDGFAVAAFRGTEFFLPGRDPLNLLQGVIADFLTDSQVALVAAPRPAQGRIHQGFLAALDGDKVFDQLNDRLADVRRNQPGAKIWFTGHSLGGALAILAAARLSGIQGVYVYGAPRVGDASFGKALAVRTIRFVHGSDAVTQFPTFGLLVPPRFPSLGRYQPNGEIVAIDRNGRLRRAGILGALGVGVGGLPTRILENLNRLLTNDLIDHAPIFYAIHIRNLLERSR